MDHVTPPRDWDIRALQAAIMSTRWDYKFLAENIKDLPVETLWNKYTPP